MAQLITIAAAPHDGKEGNDKPLDDPDYPH